MTVSGAASMTWTDSDPKLLCELLTTKLELTGVLHLVAPNIRLHKLSNIGVLTNLGNGLHIVDTQQNFEK